jgi:O-methyltransferase involved in polyketide biosynthesis
MSKPKPKPKPGSEHAMRLGTIQETLLIPLYGRAVESRKPEAVLRDPAAEAMVSAIDYDFSRFDGGPSLAGTVMRTHLFDHWVRAFLAEHPGATVVEIGTGLNTRYERTDNGRAHWFELDLPDVIELRRNFFTDTPRRRMLAASVLDEGWTGAPAARGGPYFLAAEAVLSYLPEDDVRRVIALLAERFPGALLALDTTGPGMIDTQESHDALSKVTARLRWNCPDPQALEQWRPGIRLLASHTFTSLPAEVHDGLPAENREMIARMGQLRLPQVDDYRLNLLRLG